MAIGEAGIHLIATLGARAGSKRPCAGRTSIVHGSCCGSQYHGDPDLLSILDGDPPVRDRLVAVATQVLDRIRVTDPARHANDLVSLFEALLSQHFLQTMDIDA